MQLKDTFGIRLVLQDEREPTFTREPVTADVLLSYADEVVGTAQFFGTVVVGQTLVKDFPLEFDRLLRVTIISRGPSGQPDRSMMTDAVSKVVEISRETLASEVGQSGNSSTVVIESVTRSKVVLGVKGFSRAARYRKVEVAEDEAMTVGLTTKIYDSADELSRELPYFVDVLRPSEGAAVTMYIRVAHSGGLSYGPWSNVVEVTFPNASGIGGSSGDFDPIPRGELNVELP